MDPAEKIVHAVGSHSWFWSWERNGQNHMVNRKKEQTRGLRTHCKTVVLMRVERTCEKKFLRSSDRILSCLLISLRISLLLLLATESIVFISLCPGKAAVLANRVWSKSTERSQGQGGRSKQLCGP